MNKAPRHCGSNLRTPLAKTSNQGGFALAESMVAMALVSLMLSGLFAMNGRLLALLKQGKESTYASQIIQERVDGLRIGLWDEVTDATRLANTVLSGPTVTATNLPGVTETITIEPLAGTNNPITCVRSPSGTVTKSGNALTSERTIKATVTVRWKSQNRIRERAAVTVLANGGI
jgi:hypothetical protein